MCKSVNKFTDNDLIEKVVGYDIFCLHETHCDLDQWLELHEFSRSVHLIRFKNINWSKGDNNLTKSSLIVQTFFFHKFFIRIKM
jgi:hypothetical protein